MAPEQVFEKVTLNGQSTWRYSLLEDLEQLSSRLCAHHHNFESLNQPFRKKLERIFVKCRQWTTSATARKGHTILID